MHCHLSFYYFWVFFSYQKQSYFMKQLRATDFNACWCRPVNRIIYLTDFLFSIFAVNCQFSAEPATGSRFSCFLSSFFDYYGLRMPNRSCCTIIVDCELRVNLQFKHTITIWNAFVCYGTEWYRTSEKKWNKYNCLENVKWRGVLNRLCEWAWAVWESFHSLHFWS